MYLTKKQIQKQVLRGIAIVIFIFALAAILIHGIFQKFNNQETDHIETDAIEVSFYNKDSREINISRMTPMTDAVGLSTNPYTFIVKNKTQQPLQYKIVLLSNEEKKESCGCESSSISLSDIKVNIQKGNQNLGSFTLDTVNQMELWNSTLDPEQSEKYNLRFWVQKNAKIENKHFHAILKIIK